MTLAALDAQAYLRWDPTMRSYDMTPQHELAHEAWSEYLDAVSKELLNSDVSIEIIKGAQPPVIEARKLALRAVAYDRRGDVFEVAVARGEPHLPSVLRHMVDHPERIVVDSWTLLAPMTISVEGRDGVRTVVKIAARPELAG